MLNNRFQQYFLQLEIAWIYELLFFRITKKVIRFKSIQLFIKTENFISTLFSFWYIVTVFVKIPFRYWFNKPNKKKIFKEEFDNFLKTQDHHYTIEVNTKYKQLIFLELLIFRLLYNWNILPDREKNFINNVNKNKSLNLIVSNVKIDPIRQPILAQVQNAHVDSFSINWKFNIQPNYNFFIYFFLFFYKLS